VTKNLRTGRPAAQGESNRHLERRIEYFNSIGQAEAVTADTDRACHRLLRQVRASLIASNLLD
jgi:hypothetical protein